VCVSLLLLTIYIICVLPKSVSLLLLTIYIKKNVCSSFILSSINHLYKKKCVRPPFLSRLDFRCEYSTMLPWLCEPGTVAVPAANSQMLFSRAVHQQSF